MNNLLAILIENGEIIELTLTEPYTYMLFGFFLYAFACGGTMIPDSEKIVFSLFTIGSVLFAASFLLYLYQSKEILVFYFILSLFVILSCLYFILIYKNKNVS